MNDRSAERLRLAPVEFAARIKLLGKSRFARILQHDVLFMHNSDHEPCSEGLLWAAIPPPKFEKESS